MVCFCSWASAHSSNMLFDLKVFDLEGWYHPEGLWNSWRDEFGHVLGAIWVENDLGTPVAFREMYLIMGLSLPPLQLYRITFAIYIRLSLWTASFQCVIKGVRTRHVSIALCIMERLFRRSQVAPRSPFVRRMPKFERHLRAKQRAYKPWAHEGQYTLDTHRKLCTNRWNEFLTWQDFRLFCNEYFSRCNTF
jgi:hypothetical protein